ncbi:phosphatase PAP2 family protein [Mongoliitalea daihaiensis]|uniref:phosphatase PAP2 family protein n=1 Tax=Mongoliitalea daihaiensis TaxID=2782006 RepID=UPI001F3885CC|nr:phosphatase PAP2 family protein [Mongoliitalea daihaiensis]UJP65147.1 phosphatase PAP2 family protein [Mongoliitalea daihaiensis]
MAKKGALIVSYLLQPLVIPTLIILFVATKASFWLKIPAYEFNQVLSAVALTTLVIPMMILMAMRWSKLIPSFQLPEKEDRFLPFVSVSVLYMMATYFFHLKLQASPPLVFLLSIITIALVLLTTVTYFWKISAHMVAMAGFLGVVSAFAFKAPQLQLVNYLIGIVLLNGLVASSRLYLNAHTPHQVIAGFLLGFALNFFPLYYLI